MTKGWILVHFMGERFFHEDIVPARILPRSPEQYYVTYSIKGKTCSTLIDANNFNRTVFQTELQCYMHYFPQENI